MESRKLCFITIGEVNDALISEITSLVEGDVELIHIPFILASEDSEWKKWSNRTLQPFGGIGAGAAGCLLGHRYAWKKLIESNFEFALVLESDAELTNFGRDYFSNVVSQFSILDCNILHLGTHERFTASFSGFKVLNLSLRAIAKEIWERLYLKSKSPKFAERQFPFSTHAYLIKEEAAAFLASQEVNFVFPVDVMLNSYSQVVMNKIWRCRTPVLIQRDDLVSYTRKLGR